MKPEHAKTYAKAKTKNVDKLVSKDEIAELITADQANQTEAFIAAAAERDDVDPVQFIQDATEGGVEGIFENTTLTADLGGDLSSLQTVAQAATQSAVDVVKNSDNEEIAASARA